MFEIRFFAINMGINIKRGKGKRNYQMSGFPEINGLDRWLDVHV